MGHRCSVLIVDDDPDSREFLRAAVIARGYSVSSAANGRDALTYLRSTADTCVILLNLMMPTMDGEQFRAAQLHDRALAWIPVIICSGAVDAGRRARALGAAYFLRKPLDLDQLRQALHNIGCARQEARRARRTSR
jgi:CheY-like chemotaxis protein